MVVTGSVVKPVVVLVCDGAVTTVRNVVENKIRGEKRGGELSPLV
jgi:hypothetical protein